MVVPEYPHPERHHHNHQPHDEAADELAKENAPRQKRDVLGGEHDWPPARGHTPTPTGLTNSPIPSMAIRITSPSRRVNLSGGTIPVPVSRMPPLGNSFSRPSQSTRSSSGRAMRSRDVAPSNAAAPPRSTRRRMPTAARAGRAAASVTHGPSAHDCLYTLACGR